MPIKCVLYYDFILLYRSGCYALLTLLDDGDSCKREGIARCQCEDKNGLPRFACIEEDEEEDDDGQCWMVGWMKIKIKIGRHKIPLCGERS